MVRTGFLALPRPQAAARIKAMLTLLEQSRYGSAFFHSGSGEVSQEVAGLQGLSPCPEKRLSQCDLPLVEVYQKMFQGVIADTPQLQLEAQRLRYQVYCLERNFEDPGQNPGGVERDEYDDHSVHALLLHRDSGSFVGTVRLILHKPGAREGSLPFHKLCQDPRLRDPDFLPFETMAEFSRLAISKSFRRRGGDGIYGKVSGLEDIAVDPRRVIPHITLGLMTMALQVGITYGIECVCAVAEPPLLRLLARFGIVFKSLGPLVNYHGLRQPCYEMAAPLLARIEAERPDIWEVVTDRGRLWKGSQSHEKLPSYL